MSKPPIIFSRRWWALAWLIFRELRRGRKLKGHAVDPIVSIETKEQAALWTQRLGRNVTVGDKIDFGRVTVTDR